MTAAELKTIREALGLPVAWLAKQADVQERTVRYWESGKAAVPEDVSHALLEIDLSFDKVVYEAVESLKAAVSHHGQPVDITLVRYSDESTLWGCQPEFKGMPVTSHAAMMFRVKKELEGRGAHVSMVYYDPEACKEWAKSHGLKQSSSTRAAWAASVDDAKGQE